MAETIENGILIRHAATKNIMTKSCLPVGGYPILPYVGCAHSCQYCYSPFIKRFTGRGHLSRCQAPAPIRNPQKYHGQRIVIGSVTDGYLPQVAKSHNTRRSGAELLICTKPDLVVRELDLLKKNGKSYRFLIHQHSG